MIVGGPNERTDYHWDEGPEFFYQLEGEMVLRIQEDGRARDIPIRAGEIFYLPPRVPHSPQRMPDSIGLVIERKRLPHEHDGLLWFCERCNHKLYEEFFPLREHRERLPAGVRALLLATTNTRTCNACGTLNPAPARATGMPGHRELRAMLKIDTHAHFLPRDWPDLAASTATTASR